MFRGESSAGSISEAEDNDTETVLAAWSGQTKDSGYAKPGKVWLLFLSCIISLRVFSIFCHFLHFSPLGITSARVCSCLLSLTAGLAHSGRDGWIDLAGTHSQPGNVRKSSANTETVQMDLTCCCFLFVSNISIFLPRLSSHMCLNTYSAGSRWDLCSYRLRIGH